METIDRVIYINLAHRMDRREQIEKELSIFPSEKIVRFDAIKHEKGGIGCSMSHIGALELAIQNKWKNVLIVEDDMEWNDFQNGCKILSNLVTRPYDVIMLNGHRVFYNSQTYKLKKCLARTAYLVSNHYFQMLIQNYKEGINNLKRSYIDIHRGDNYWNRLQEKDNWYIIPYMCKQRPSFSDIEQCVVDYKDCVAPEKPRFGFNRNVRFIP